MESPTPRDSDCNATPVMTTTTAPFDSETNSNPDTSVILRSCDGVRFYANKFILSIASSVFRNMFSDAQPHTPLSGEDVATPVIDVAEKSDTLDALLRACYPFPPPLPNSLPLLISVLETAEKYELESLTSSAKQKLLSFLDRDDHHVLEVYAASWRLGWEKGARAAASRWRTRVRESSQFSASGAGSSRVTKVAPSFMSLAEFSSPRNDQPDESTRSANLIKLTFVGSIERISAGAFFRLIKYARHDVEPPIKQFCPHKSAPICNSNSGNHVLAQPFQFLDADIVLVASDGVRFRVHSTIITLASPVLAGKISIALKAKENVPEIVLECDALVTATILHVYYPFQLPEPSHIELTHKLIHAASIYKMTKALQLGRKALMSHLPRHPLRCYFLARAMRWKTEALESVKHLGTDVMGVYDLQLEHESARSYVNLLRLCATLSRKIDACVQDVHSSLQRSKQAFPRNLEQRKVQKDGVDLVALVFVEKETQVVHPSPLFYDKSQSDRATVDCGVLKAKTAELYTRLQAIITTDLLPVDDFDKLVG